MREQDIVLIELLVDKIGFHQSFSFNRIRKALADARRMPGDNVKIAGSFERDGSSLMMPSIHVETGKKLALIGFSVMHQPPIDVQHPENLSDATKSIEHELKQYEYASEIRDGRLDIWDGSARLFKILEKLDQLKMFSSKEVHQVRDQLIAKYVAHTYLSNFVQDIQRIRDTYISPSQEYFFPMNSQREFSKREAYDLLFHNPEEFTKNEMGVFYPKPHLLKTISELSPDAEDIPKSTVSKPRKNIDRGDSLDISL